MDSKPITTVEGLHEVVEACLENEDITPLVRLVFDANPPGEPLPLPVNLDSESGTTTLDEAGAALRENPLEVVLEALQEVAEDKEAEIQQICRSNAVEISAALHDLSSMQRTASTLRSRLGANNERLQGAGASFLAHLEGSAEMLRVQQGVADTRKAVNTAIEIMSQCVRAGRYIEGRQLYKAFRVLEGIQKEYVSVLRGPHDARLVLEAKDINITPSKPSGPASAAAPAPAPASAAPPVHLGPLAPFLRERVNELTLALEAKAMADFNEWLVTVRTQARTIGLRAIRWAAAERQHEERLARQRKEQAQRLAAGTAAAAGAGGGDGHGGERVPGMGRSAADVGREIAAALAEPEVRAAAAVTPAPLPGARVPPPVPLTPSSIDSSPGQETVTGSPGRSPLGAGASFRALRQQAAGGGAGADATPSKPSLGPSFAGATPPGTAASGVGRHAGAAPTPATPPQPLGAAPRGSAGEGTGDLLEGVDFSPLHRAAQIHACLRRLPSLVEYYVENRRRQLESDLGLQGTPFLEAYQAYLTQIVGYFLVEERVQRSTASTAGVPSLDIAAQVGAAWERTVMTLKGVLDDAFQGATAAAAMLTVKDFMLLVCLALEQCGYHSVAIREILLVGRAKYHELLGAATQEAVQAAVSKDADLAAVEVKSDAKAEEYFRHLALPATFHHEDAANKRPPFKAPFTPMIPGLVRIIRGYIIDSVAYLQGLVSAGEVVPAAKQYRDRMLAKVVVEALQKRVDAAAGEPKLPLARALQLVANVAALMQGMAPLDDFAVAQARGEPTDALPPRSPTPSPRSSPGGSPHAASSGGGGGSLGLSLEHSRGRRRSLEYPELQQQRGQGGGEGQGQGAGGEGPGSRGPSPGRSSSRGSAISHSGSRSASPGPAPNQQQAQQGQLPSGGQQAGDYTTLSLHAGRGPAGGGPAGGGPAQAGGGASGASVAAVAFQTLLESAEALVLQVVAQRLSSVLSRGESLDWAPDKPQRALEGACSPYIEEAMLYIKEVHSLMIRAAPDASVARMMRLAFRYLADATMLQLLSDAVPTYNIFGLQRLFSDLGGLSRCAKSVGVPGLADELREPFLFCELMVFGSLEELLRPELREGKYWALNLRRVALVLDKYRELDKSSGFAGMHKSKQAERFISRKTVEGVAKQLKDLGRAVSSSGRVSDRSS